MVRWGLEERVRSIGEADKYSVMVIEKAGTSGGRKDGVLEAPERIVRKSGFGEAADLGDMGDSLHILNGNCEVDIEMSAIAASLGEQGGDWADNGCDRVLVD